MLKLKANMSNIVTIIRDQSSIDVFANVALQTPHKQIDRLAIDAENIKTIGDLQLGLCIAYEIVMSLLRNIVVLEGFARSY